MAETILKYDVFDVSTGKNSKVELTEAELAQRELDAAEANAQIAALEAKAAARQSALAKLAELGLTADEIAAL